MQIQLNQTEIFTALKDYVIKQGISLQGRTVEIVITSGRRDNNGASADMCISDDADDFPVFTSEEVQVSTLGAVVGVIGPAQDTFNSAVSAESLPDVTVDPPTKPTSLFGS